MSWRGSGGWQTACSCWLDKRILTSSFLRRQSVDVGAIVLDAYHRWAATSRRWLLGEIAEVQADADPDRLAVALDALIENAVNHTRPEDSIEMAVRRSAATAVISVRDSGTGISREDLDRIFHRFARADPGRSRNTGGFGLGLSIVRAIVEAHGGSVAVRSTPGEGSVFEILLSATPSEQPPAELLSRNGSLLRPASPAEAGDQDPAWTRG